MVLEQKRREQIIRQIRRGIIVFSRSFPLLMLFSSFAGAGSSSSSRSGGGAWGWIVSAEASTGSGGTGRSGSFGGGAGFWTVSASSPSNVGIAIAVTAMAGIALAATVAYSHRGSLKSPWSRRRRKHVLLAKQWKSFFTPDGRLSDDGVKFLKKARSGGIDPSIRAEVWPFLLGVYNLNSSKEERDCVRAEKRKEFEDLRKQCMRNAKRNDKSLKLKESASISSGIEYTGDMAHVMDSPGLEEVTSGRRSPSAESSSGAVEDSDYLNQTLGRSDSKFEGDGDKSVITCEDGSVVDMESSDSDSSEEPESKEPFLISDIKEEDDEFDVPAMENPSHSSRENKSQSCKDEDFATWQRIMRIDAVRANGEWIMYSPSQAAVSEVKARRFAERVGLKDYDHLEPCRIYHAARLVSILEAYALYDPEIGYCQGMSDLLSPIVIVMEEDDEAFWCFVGFMKKARHNFRLDEVGIRRQLGIISKIIKCKDIQLYRHLEKLQAEDCFFVYRMVVVLFRRELNLDQTLRLWEVIWADQVAIRAGIAKSAWGKMRLKAPPTDDLLLYAIAACVLQRRKLIIEKYNGMDEIMRECNSMAGHLDVWKLLDDAHDLVVSLHDKI